MFKIFVHLMFLLMVDVVLCKPEYIYHYEAEGWLKLHAIPATWQDAFRKCHYEGAVLASPLNQDLASAFHNVVTNSAVDSDLHLGIHSLYVDGDFFSVEGVSLKDMYIKWGPRGWAGEGNCLAMSSVALVDQCGVHLYTSKISVYASSCTKRLPYICYKKRGKNMKINECGTFDSQYRLNEKTGSCYKLHEQPKSWPQAYEICAAEGGYLAIINNEEEASIIRAMYPSKQNPSEWDRMLIGIRDLFEDQMWLTIHGERMEDVYHKWSNSQPDNFHGRQFCGNLYRNGGFDDNNCEDKFPFVCEKDPRFEHYDPNIILTAGKIIIL